MLKYKSWLVDVDRKGDSYVNPNMFRFDKSERTKDFEAWKFDLEFKRQLVQADFLAYPDGALLKKYVCDYVGFDITPENLFVSYGSDQVIKAMFETFVTEGSTVITTDPCFPMYDVYTKLFNAKMNKIKYDTSYTYSIDKILDSIDGTVSLIILSNPNNPIGNSNSPEMFIPIAEKAGRYGIPVLIDEAYIEFCSQASVLGSECQKYENIFVARTASKAVGGAGIRLGYLIGKTHPIQIINKWKPMYPCTGATIKFMKFICDNKTYVSNYANSTVHELYRAVELLKLNKYDVIGSKANWIHFNDSSDNVVTTGILDRYGVLYKSNATLPYDDRKNWIRLTIGPGITELKFFDEILKKGGV